MFGKPLPMDEAVPAEWEESYDIHLNMCLAIILL